MSSTPVMLLCLLAMSALVYTEGRTLKQTKCDPDLCTAALNTDPEKIRPHVNAGDTSLCGCTCDAQGNTLLHLSGSTEGGCVLCVDLLVDPPLKCNVDVNDNGGNTPLHDSASLCQIPMSDKFLAFGANPNAMNDAGDTPICKAVMNGIERCARVIKKIIEKGGDPCKKCSNGKFPYDIATNSVVRDIIANGGGDSC